MFSNLTVKFVNYSLNFPKVFSFIFTLFCRSLLTTPWFEFGGPATITCKESGYTCHVDFHTKVSHDNLFQHYEYLLHLLVAIQRGTEASSNS